MTTKPMEPTYNLPESLKKILETKGITAAELARRSGVSMASLSRILSGQVNPTLDNVVKIAHVLNVSLDQLSGQSVFSAITSNEDENPHQRGRRKEDNGFNPERDILVSYVMNNTEYSAQECMNLLIDAANGNWVDSWTNVFVNHDTVPQVKGLSATPLSAKKVQVNLIFPHDMVEAGSLVSLVSMVGSAVTSTGAQIMDIRIPTSLSRTFRTPGFGVNGLRDTANKFGRPLLSATMRPMNGLSPRMYGRAVYETLKGGVDITCDPTMMHSLPDNTWRRRYRYVSEAIYSAQQETNETKFHAVNVSADTIEEMIKRAEYAKELDLNMILVDSSAVGWAGLSSLAVWAQDNDVIVSAMGGRSLLSATMSEALIAKILRFTGCDIVSIGSPLRGSVGNRRHVNGIVRMLTEEEPKQSLESGIAFDQPTCGHQTVWPAVGGGHNPWHFPRLLDAMGDDMIIQCGGAVMGHPWGLGSGATACRVALEAVVQARGEGSNLTVDGRAILQRAARYNGELKTALEYWNEGAFLFGVVNNVKPLDGAIGAKVVSTQGETTFTTVKTTGKKASDTETDSTSTPLNIVKPADAETTPTQPTKED